MGVDGLTVWVAFAFLKGRRPCLTLPFSSPSVHHLQKAPCIKPSRPSYCREYYYPESKQDNFTIVSRLPQKDQASRITINQLHHRQPDLSKIPKTTHLPTTSALASKQDTTRPDSPSQSSTTNKRDSKLSSSPQPAKDTANKKRDSKLSSPSPAPTQKQPSPPPPTMAPPTSTKPRQSPAPSTSGPSASSSQIRVGESPPRGTGKKSKSKSNAKPLVHHHPTEKVRDEGRGGNGDYFR